MTKISLPSVLTASFTCSSVFQWNDCIYKGRLSESNIAICTCLGRVSFNLGKNLKFGRCKRKKYDKYDKNVRNFYRLWLSILIVTCIHTRYTYLSF